jgi:phage tail-like protein
MVDFTLGKQQALTKQQRDEALTSATFQIEAEGKTANFSELAGISTEIEMVEYMEAGPKGPVFGRLAGKAKPPTETLKRAMGVGQDTTWIWAWHASARQAQTEAFKDTTLKLFTAGKPDAPVKSYLLTNAFPTKVEIAGMKAGATEIALQTLTLQCDNIEEAP